MARLGHHREPHAGSPIGEILRKGDDIEVTLDAGSVEQAALVTDDRDPESGVFGAIGVHEAQQALAWKLILLVFIQVIFVTMVYGPIAAYLVEAFPAKIRYTALSLPYHIGNGIFGGLLPLIGLWVIEKTGNIYAGLYYPIVVASITFIVGSLLLKETKHTLIWDEVK